MKKFINDPRRVVREMLEGQVLLHAAQALMTTEDVVLVADLPADAEARPVAVLSGGGSGHEPAHAGYVGYGMLSAAVVGDVFTSPSVDAVLAAIRAVAGPRGALLIVKNYTGDRLNFGLAAELAAADGIPTRIVVVADDVALRNTVARERRRGIAGTVLVEKIAGAAAASGASLDAVFEAAQAASHAVGTMGVALGACTVPAAGAPSFELGPDEMEFGLGIHGEPGVSREKIQPALQIAETIVGTICEDMGLAAGQSVALLVNGLGGTPPMELAIVAREALAALERRGIFVERAFAGDFMTALEMAGCSITLMKLDGAMIAGLDAACHAPAWTQDGRIRSLDLVAGPPPDGAAPGGLAGAASPALKAMALRVAAAFQREEARLTELDRFAGDGDLGISMARGAEAIRTLPDGAWTTPAKALGSIGDALRRAIGGSSGPFYAVALIRAARHLASGEVDDAALADAFTQAVAAIGELGGAKLGDRTMLDALIPAAEAFATAVAAGEALDTAWGAAIAAAEAGAATTASLAPKLGRASYLGARAIGSPDAGAVAVLVWMRALAG